MSKEIKKNETTEETEMGFFEHLEILRWHILRAVASIMVMAIILFIAKDFVFQEVIFAPKHDDFLTYRFFCSISEATCLTPPELELRAIELGEQFFVHIKVAIWLGFTLAFPYVFWEFWRFVKPGLYPKEKKAARGLVFICSMLFVLGVLFGYYVVSPVAITWLGNYSVGVDTVNNPSLSSYVNYLTMFTIPSGIMFELPVLIYFLAKVGLVSSIFLRKYRKHAMIVVLILAALITPPDVVTQLLIGIPVIFLYEIGIMVCKRVEKQNQV